MFPSICPSVRSVVRSFMPTVRHDKVRKRERERKRERGKRMDSGRIEQSGAERRHAVQLARLLSCGGIIEPVQ